MRRYNDLIEEIVKRGIDKRFEKVSEDRIDKECNSNPAVPQDYIDFLKEIGWGTIGEMYYAIYSGLIEPNEIYDPIRAKDLDGILLFGDDYSGYCAGFVKKDSWQLVEIDDFQGVDYLNITFEEFVRDKFKSFFKVYDKKVQTLK
jgi:hypothetical protein